MAASFRRLPQAHLPLSDSNFERCTDVNLDAYNGPEPNFVAAYTAGREIGRSSECKLGAAAQAAWLSSSRSVARSLRRSARAACSSDWYCESTSTKPSPTS